VRHAAAADPAGYARTVLITHGSRAGRRWRIARYADGGLVARWAVSKVPVRVFGPTTTFTIPLLRYMKEFGLTHEQLAYVAVAQRRWGGQEPARGLP